MISLDQTTQNILKKVEKTKSQVTRYIFENEFGKPIPTSLPRKWLLGILKDSKLRPIKIHGFRHTHASLCFDAGMTLKTSPTPSWSYRFKDDHECIHSYYNTSEGRHR